MEHSFDLTQTQRVPRDVDVPRDSVHRPPIVRPPEWSPLYKDHSALPLGRGYQLSNEFGVEVL
jgi:hypothetical protein